jgi:hypothetical protein
MTTVSLALACTCVVVSAMSSAQTKDAASWLDGARAPRAFHSVYVDDERSSLSLMVRRVVVLRGTSEAPGCDVATGRDPVVVHFTVASHGPAAYAGALALLVLAYETGGALEGVDEIPAQCGLGGRGLEDFEPPITPGARRRLQALFLVPNGARLIRLDYHDDDFPRRFALPPAVTRALP